MLNVQPTPQEQLAQLTDARRMLTVGLANAPRGFIIHFEGFGYFAVLAFAGSFGYYVGTMINAAIWFPLIPDLELKGFLLPDGSAPKPVMMLVKDGFNRAIEETNKAIEGLKNV